MVVVEEPAVKGGGAFVACAVDGAVGPAVEHGADQALGFAVGLRSARPGAEVADAEAAAGDCVRDRDVGGAIVGDHPLDLDAVAGEEGECTAQEGDRGRRLFVAEHLGVGETAVVVDGDVDVVPAGCAALVAVAVALARPSLAREAKADALAGRLEAAELLDVDVHELTRT